MGKFQYSKTLFLFTQYLKFWEGFEPENDRVGSECNSKNNQKNIIKWMNNT